ncbi:MAG: hypothetical protein LBK97_04525 [Prevotellaceae bacterium]|jgi:hypothetical protein|nr:hypothetical protein [Prevotellaceae bacterium]
MTLRFSFFKTPQHKRFEYTPRIWDPEKEDREERLKRIQEELGIIDTASGGKPYVPNIKGSFRKEYELNKKSKNKTSYSNRIRSYIIIATGLLLGIIFFYFMRIYPYMFSGNGQDNNEHIDNIEFYE